jgi:acyl-CoA reductase-like NAD-dependent aldehyde dehydrogenase
VTLAGEAMFTTLTKTADHFIHSPQQHFIGGKSLSSGSGAMQEVYDPSTGAVLTSVNMAGVDEVNAAVAAAQAAFLGWAKTPLVERAVVLHRLADALEKHATDLVQIESVDVGKAIVAAEGFDIPFGIKCVRYFADLLQHVAVNVPHALPNIEARTFRAPYGVCGFIFPWNFPYNLLLWNVTPALAAGNTVGY